MNLRSLLLDVERKILSGFMEFQVEKFWERLTREAYRTGFEDRLIAILYDWLRKEQLSPKGCVDCLIRWDRESHQLVERRLLVDLFTLLQVCDRDKTLTMLRGFSAPEADEFAQRGKHNKAFAELCQALVDILEAQDGRELKSHVKHVWKLTNDLGSKHVGIAGADGICRFYSLVYGFLRELERPYIVPRIARWDGPESEIEAVRDAQRWLNRLAVMKPEGLGVAVEDLKPSLFCFYLREAEEELRWLPGLTMIEQVLLTRLVDDAKWKICEQEKDLRAWISVKDDLPVCFVANVGSSWTGYLEVLKNGSLSSDRIKTTLTSDPLRLESLDSLSPGENEVEVRASSIWGRRPSDRLGPWFLFQSDSPNRDKGEGGYDFKLIRYRHKYDPNPEIQDWIIPADWWDDLRNVLGEKGSIKVVYGLPRTGKTTCLQETMRSIKDKRDSTIFVYINLERLLPGDEAGKDLSMLRRDILEQAERKVASKLERPKRDFTHQTVNESQSRATLNGYFDELSELAKSKKPSDRFDFVIFLDEWYLLARFDPDLWENLRCVLAATTRNEFQTDFVYCVTGLVDQVFLAKSTGDDRYLHQAEIDWKFVPVRPLSREQIEEVLEGWLRPAKPIDLPEPLFDDLALRLIERYTGGHRFLLIVFAHHLVEALRKGCFDLPLSWRSVQEMWRSPLLTGDDIDRSRKFYDFEIDMHGALETIWLGLLKARAKGGSDVEKLYQVLEGRSWQALQEMLDCGLVRLNECDQPVLGIGALEPWYRSWRAENIE